MASHCLGSGMPSSVKEVSSGYPLTTQTIQSVKRSRSVARLPVKSGDVIDGFTIVGQPDGIPFPATLNASGEVLFTTGAISPDGTADFALFTPHHLVAAPGDTIDGLTAQGGVGLSSINDAGQIAFLIFLDQGTVRPR